MKSIATRQAALPSILIVFLLLLCCPAVAQQTADPDMEPGTAIGSGPDEDIAEFMEDSSDDPGDNFSDDLGDDFSDETQGDPDSLGDDFEDFEDEEAGDEFGETALEL